MAKACAYLGCPFNKVCPEGYTCMETPEQGFVCTQSIAAGYYCKVSDAVDRCEEGSVCYSDPYHAQLGENADLGICTVLSDLPAPTSAPPAATVPDLLRTGSCKGVCGQQGQDGDDTRECYCDTECHAHGDCCSDYEDECVEGPTGRSCAGRCGDPFSPGRACYCDFHCTLHDDCCSDYTYVCEGKNIGTCKGTCGAVGAHFLATNLALPAKNKYNATNSTGDKTVNWCTCKTSWSPQCSPSTNLTGCQAAPCRGGGAYCKYDSDCLFENESCIGNVCTPDFTQGRPLLTVAEQGPGGLLWCEIQNASDCLMPPQHIRWDYCTQNVSNLLSPFAKASTDNTANKGTHRSVNGCFCKRQCF